jgi:hypothetical protein
MHTVSATQPSSYSTNAVAVTSDDQRASCVSSRDHIANDCSTTNGCLRLVLVEGDGVQASHVDEHTHPPKVERCRPTIAAILSNHWDAILCAIFNLSIVSIPYEISLF